MIEITNTEVVGLEHAIRGMRNPLNSWDKSDSDYWKNSKDEFEYVIGSNDLELMKKLASAGSDHSKFLRMIVVYLDINAPMYWWKEFDTYKVGTVRNSCSTMHKIHSKEFTLDDFSVDNLEPYSVTTMKHVIRELNAYRESHNVTKTKSDWWQLIQLLPSSYNQKSTVMLNYQVLKNMYHSRKCHKLDEWKEFCKWVETLPYSELITE